MGGGGRGGFIALRDASSMSLFDLSALRSMERQSELLKCPFCELPLQTVAEADEHLNKIHKHEVHLPFGCSECGKRFFEVKPVMRHFETNGFCYNAIIRVHKPLPHQLVPPKRRNLVQRVMDVFKRK